MGTIGNINVRIGADASQLSEEARKAQNTILTFKNESMSALKSFGLPHVNSTNLVESIQAGNRVVVNFSKEAAENMQQFQQRVRTAMQEAGVDVTQYDKVLQNATQVHAEFAKGAIKNFQTVTASSEESGSKFTQFKTGLIDGFREMSGEAITLDGAIGIIGTTIDTVLPELAILGTIIATIKESVDSFKELENIATEIQDVQHRFVTSTGVMSEEASKFSETLSKDWQIPINNIKDMMGKEYLNTRMLGFDPSQSETMSENITKLSYSLGKLRGEDPSQVFDKLKGGIEGQPKGLSELGIRISDVDIKNRALAEGLIKHGQAMSDQVKSFVIYQDLMAKTTSIQGYYAQTQNDLSTQTTALKTKFEEMGEKLATALTPAFTQFLKVLNLVADGLGYVVDFISFTIQSTELLVADLHSLFSDLLNFNFSNINKQFIDNYNAIFNSADVANQYGAALDNATSAANAQDKALQNMGKTLNNTAMSFDELHNITKNTNLGAGTIVDSSGIGKLDIKSPKLPEQTDTKTWFDNISKWSDDASKKIEAWVTNTSTNIGNWITNTGGWISNWVTTHTADLGGWISDTGGKISGWVSTYSISIGNWVSNTGGRISNWVKEHTNDLGGWVTNTGGKIGNWVTVHTKGISGWAGETGTKIGTWVKEHTADLGSWITNTGQGIGTWVKTHTADISSWVLTTGTGIGTWVKTHTADIGSWVTITGSAIGIWTKDHIADIGNWVSTTGGNIADWSTKARGHISDFKTDAIKTINTFGRDFYNAFGKALKPVETLILSWVNGIGKSTSDFVNNIVSSISLIGKLLGQTVANVGTSMWKDINATFNFTAIPALASGGIITAPQLSLIGEAGPEAVIPLNQLNNIMGGTSNNSMGNNNSQQPIVLNATVKVDGRALAKVTYQYNINEVNRIGTIQGYDPSFNYPK